MIHFLCVCPHFDNALTRAGRIFSEGVSAAIEQALGNVWDCYWEVELRGTGLGGGLEIGLKQGQPMGGRVGTQVPDGVLDSRQRLLLTVIMECWLQMDNDEGAVEERLEEKCTKYHSARVVLRAGLRLERELKWKTHLSFIAGWKTTMNEKEWHANLTTLGIATAKQGKILQWAIQTRNALQYKWILSHKVLSTEI